MFWVLSIEYRSWMTLFWPKTGPCVNNVDEIFRLSPYLPISLTNAYFSCFISKQNGGAFKDWPTVHWRTGPITHRLNQKTFVQQWIWRWRKSLVSVPNFKGHWGQSNSISCLVDVLRLRGVEAPTNGSSLTGVSKATKKIRFLAMLAALHFDGWSVGHSFD